MPLGIASNDPYRVSIKTTSLGVDDYFQDLLVVKLTNKGNGKHLLT